MCGIISLLESITLRQRQAIVHVGALVVVTQVLHSSLQISLTCLIKGLVSRHGRRRWTCLVLPEVLSAFCASINYTSYVLTRAINHVTHRCVLKASFLETQMTSSCFLFLLSLLSESRATNAMGLMVLCQWSLSRGQD